MGYRNWLDFEIITVYKYVIFSAHIKLTEAERGNFVIIYEGIYIRANEDP